MSGSFGQAPHSSDHVFPRYLPRLNHALALNQFSQRGSAGHGRYAPFGFKTNLDNSISLNFQSEFQHVAAGRVGKFYRNIGMRHFPGMSWMLEVIQ